MEDISQLYETYKIELDIYRTNSKKLSDALYSIINVYKDNLLSEKTFKKIEKKLNKKLSIIQRNIQVLLRVIDELQKKCNHTLENGKSAYEYEGHDSHYDYYICTICGNTIKN